YLAAPPSRALQAGHLLAGGVEESRERLAARKRLKHARPRAVQEHHCLDGDRLNLQVLVLGPGLHHPDDLGEVLPLALALLDLAHERLRIDVYPLALTLGAAEGRDPAALRDPQVRFPHQ